MAKKEKVFVSLQQLHKKATQSKTQDAVIKYRKTLKKKNIKRRMDTIFLWEDTQIDLITLMDNYTKKLFDEAKNILTGGDIDKYSEKLNKIRTTLKNAHLLYLDTVWGEDFDRDLLVIENVYNSILLQQFVLPGDTFRKSVMSIILSFAMLDEERISVDLKNLAIVLLFSPWFDKNSKLSDVSSIEYFLDNNAIDEVKDSYPFIFMFFSQLLVNCDNTSIFNKIIKGV